jgi:hypothetical protein
MAKINETILVVKVSELVKDNSDETTLLGPEAVEQLEAVIKELSGGHALVEIEIASGEQ